MSELPEVKVSQIKAGDTVKGLYMRSNWDAEIEIEFHVVAVAIVQREARLLGVRNAQDASDSALQLFYARGFKADGTTEITEGGNELEVDTEGLYIVPVNPRYPYLRRFDDETERQVAEAVYGAVPFDQHEVASVSFAHI